MCGCHGSRWEISSIHWAVASRQFNTRLCQRAFLHRVPTQRCRQIEFQPTMALRLFALRSPIQVGYRTRGGQARVAALPNRSDCEDEEILNPVFPSIAPQTSIFGLGDRRFRLMYCTIVNGR